jgi:hypothetical protein
MAACPHLGNGAAQDLPNKTAPPILWQSPNRRNTA